jgi:chromosome partitioning protein
MKGLKEARAEIESLVLELTQHITQSRSQKVENV